ERRRVRVAHSSQPIILTAMSADPNLPSPPHIPMPKIQSLTPTSASGAMPTVARTASSSIPAAAAPVMPDAGYAPEAVEVGMAEPHVPVVIGSPPKKNAFLEYWRKVGGGSLT